MRARLGQRPHLTTVASECHRVLDPRGPDHRGRASALHSDVRRDAAAINRQVDIARATSRRDCRYTAKTEVRINHTEGRI